MSGRVVLSVTESQAKVLQALAAGQAIPADVERIVVVLAGLLGRGWIEAAVAGGGWRLTPAGAGLVGVLQADAASRTSARLAKPAAPCLAST